MSAVAENKDPERRKEYRSTLILRVGLLHQAGRSSFCLVKNISPSGAQFKFYTKPNLHIDASLQVADEPPVSGRILWVKHNIGGLSFSEQLDASTLLRVEQKLKGRWRRNTPRANVESSAVFRTGGRVCRVAVSDISSVGARIRTQLALSPADRATIELINLPPIQAYVCWADGEEAGLTFAVPIPIQLLAAWVGDRSRP